MKNYEELLKTQIQQQEFTKETVETVSEEMPLLDAATKSTPLIVTLIAISVLEVLKYPLALVGAVILTLVESFRHTR